LSTKQLLTETEVHSEYGLTPPWLRKKRRLGGGPTFVRISRMIRYRRTDIEAYLAAHLVEAREAKR
jgi:predicted DNA-binding transcriptional regulator AlpA